jgi:hypothetical protein
MFPALIILSSSFSFTFCPYAQLEMPHYRQTASPLPEVRDRMNKQVSLFAVWRETARSDEINVRKLEVLRKSASYFSLKSITVMGYG